MGIDILFVYFLLRFCAEVSLARKVIHSGISSSFFAP